MTSILSQEKLVFDATNSNEFISKSKNIFPNFYRISGICIKFGIPCKKKTSPRGDFFLRLWSRNGGVSYMHKKPLGRTLMGSLHVKGSERLLKSARQYLCHIICSLWNKISSKNSVLVVSEILRLFVNILTPDEKYCLSVKACF